MSEQSMSMTARAPKIGKEALIAANQVLRDYKAGKIQLERRIVESEKWWKLRHWEVLEAQGKAVGNPADIQPKSAWLFNVLMGKQADAIEAYPEPLILPREKLDKGESEVLTSVIPVILQQNDFEETYSKASWTKNKSGTAVYGVFWDPSKLNGLGDIAVRSVDVLNLFWQPGVTDIQQSRNFFHCELMDTVELEERYPHLQGQLKPSEAIPVAEYIYDDHVKKDGKTLVIDWFYKRWQDGRTVLHYCKYVGTHVLFASENDPEMEETGWYIDGNYPFVFDALFPVEGSPCGHGYIDIGKSPQTVIDMLDQQIVKSAIIGATPRHFFGAGAGVNEEEYMDITKPIVHCSDVSDINIREIDKPQLSPLYIDVKNQKIEEMKYTSANLDVSNGSAGGVTAASAIAALQETAGRSSRASIKGTYRAYSKLVNMVIERIRQFYDIKRTFRIIGPAGMEKFVAYSNANLQAQQMIGDFGTQPGVRLPVFDVDVRAQKQSAYSRLSQNELAIQFYQMGFFNPMMADQALLALNMMDFAGKDEVEMKIREMQMMMMGGMPMMPGPGGMMPPQGAGPAPQLGEASHVQRARMQAGQAAQPST